MLPCRTDLGLGAKWADRFLHRCELWKPGNTRKCFHNLVRAGQVCDPQASWTPSRSKSGGMQAVPGTIPQPQPDSIHIPKKLTSPRLHGVPKQTGSMGAQNRSQESQNPEVSSISCGHQFSPSCPYVYSWFLFACACLLIIHIKKPIPDGPKPLCTRTPRAKGILWV